MPWNIIRNGAIVEKEILKSPSGLEDVKNGVVDATTVPEHPTSSGRYILEAGTVLVVSGTKVKPASSDITGNGEVVFGILGTNVEFFIGDSVSASAASNEPVPVYHFNCHFDITQLVHYAGNEAAIATALPHCLFD